MKEVTDPALLAELNKGAPKGPTPRSQVTTEPDYSASAGMGAGEKFLVGAGGGLKKTYIGIKDLLGMASEEDLEEVREWAKSKEGLGGWGTAGEITGELAATAIPGAGASSLVAKGATKALPVLSRIGSAGGRIANVGTAGRAAVEGAVSGAIQVPQEGDSRLGNAVGGAAAATLLPLSVAGAGAGKRAIRNKFTPKGIAGSGLDRTLGRDTVDLAASQIRGASGHFPQTTAALTGDPTIGALERGARGRGTADFAGHDEDVARAAWERVKAGTASAEDLAVLRSGPQQVQAAGQDLMDQIPLPDSARAELSQELLDIRNTNEVIANPTLHRQIDRIIAGLDNPNATMGLLPEIQKVMGETPSPAMQRVQALLQQHADDASGGQLVNAQAGAGAAASDLAAAQGAANVRGKFMNEELNIPLTKDVVGKVGTPSAGPVLEAHPLRQAMAAEGAQMRPAELQQLGGVADDLARHEISKVPGDAGLDLGGAAAQSASAINLTPAWRARGIPAIVFKGLDDRARRHIDEALLDPQRFLQMVELQRALKRPLEPWQQRAVDYLMSGQARALGGSVTDE
jgi:hypothetical protein